MRKVGTGRTLALLCATAGVILAASMAQAVPSTFYHPGDVLTYDIGVDVKLHVSSAQSPTPQAFESTVNGTETISIGRADPDGSLHGNLNLALTANTAGTSQSFARTLAFKIAPDDTTSIENGDPSMNQYLAMLNQAHKSYGGRVLHVGDVINQTLSLPGTIPLTLTTTAKVVAQKVYRGYPTFAIQVTGTAPVDTQVQGMPTKGMLTVAGTDYYDQHDEIFVGAAVSVNGNLTVGDKSQTGHIKIAETQDVELKSLVRGKAAPPAQTPAPAPSLTATPGPSIVTPVPIPTNGYYTPPPPSPSPS